MLKLKRAYEKPVRQDGLRILVERLWPRGISKEKAAVDLWLKDLAPSSELRKWFGHDHEKWNEFRNRYWAELKEKHDLMHLLKRRTTEGAVTFVYGSADEQCNSAVALKEYLEERVK